MSEPFVFFTQASLVQATHFRADSLPSLLYCLNRVSDSSIFHHFYHSLLREHFLKIELTNDFARWADQTLREPVLAEQLATVDPLEFKTVRAVRKRLIEYVAPFVGPLRHHMRVPAGMEFRFQESKSFVFPTGTQANSLEEFAELIRDVSVATMFYHFITARLRLDEDTNDFSLWIAERFGDRELAEAIEALNPFRDSLAELRARASDLVQGRLQ